MNKLFIILLAVGLATAFVKRDAPAEASTENYLDAFKKEFDSITSNLKEAFDAETIKKNFNDVVDKLADAANKLKPKDDKQ